MLVAKCHIAVVIYKVRRSDRLVDKILGNGSDGGGGKSTPHGFRITALNKGGSPLSVGHAGASSKSPNDTHWEMLSLRLSTPISAQLLTLDKAPAGVPARS